MKSRTLLSAGALFALALAPVIASAAPDPRFERQMDKTGLKYKFDDDDDARIAFDSTWGGEDVIVYVNNNTSDLGNLTVRDVWCVAFVSDDIPGPVILQAMSQNDDLKIGAWTWFQLKNEKEILKFSYAAPTDLSGAQLADVIQAIASTVDKFRKEHHDEVPE